MQDYEKLGVFYLGKEYDLEKSRLKDDLILYKSKDLTTHAVIIGMTGSGKTGLGIGIIEEAIIDNIPVIAIDPKGDLGNIALTFPQLSGEDFLPWINLHEAANKGLAANEYAQAQADLWRKGLADWGQDGERIKRLGSSADITVYTPGGTAGPGVSVLRSFNAPSIKVRNDLDAYRDRIHITATGLLSLIGVSGDPFTSREHILVSNILEYVWNQGRDLDLPGLISAIQSPPLDKIGVMTLESFYPSKDRFSLAMLLNNLLASTGFKAWMEGTPLDANQFLFNEKGAPRVSVFSINHLSDSERMFFVTMLLNEILSWVRTQPGTGSLRALLYMDELFGYLPPTANPPSKTPLLTLLKQARAFGLGLVLSTQNPVDLDYKALSNAGTWFIGRLQTERDKERVLAGLEGAAAGGKFDRRRTEQILAGLKQRLFYLHSVHEDEPVIFNTRWTLSYLAGPLTREQIASLPQNTGRKQVPDSHDYNLPSKYKDDFVGNNASAISTSPPILAPQIQQVYLPVTSGSIGNLMYMPMVIGIADVLYNNSKHGVTTSKSYTLLAPIKEGPIALDWNEAEFLEMDIADLDTQPLDGISYGNFPSAATNVKSYDNWKKLFNQYIRTNIFLKLFSSPKLKTVSTVDEDERDFRVRMQHLAHEKRDEALETLKKKYSSKIDTLEDRHQRAKQAVEKQSTMASQRKMDAAVSTGTALLSAFLGKKSASVTSISRMGTAVKSTNKALKSGQGISQAQEKLESVENQLTDLQLELEKEIDKISEVYDLIDERLDEIEIRATSTNITIQLVSLAWVPKIK